MYNTDLSYCFEVKIHTLTTAGNQVIYVIMISYTIVEDILVADKKINVAFVLRKITPFLSSLDLQLLVIGSTMR